MEWNYLMYSSTHSLNSFACNNLLEILCQPVKTTLYKIATNIQFTHWKLFDKSTKLNKNVHDLNQPIQKHSLSKSSVKRCDIIIGTTHLTRLQYQTNIIKQDRRMDCVLFNIKQWRSKDKR